MHALESLQNIPIVPVLLLAGSLWFIGTLIYNLYFHPLRHIPGPRIAAASRLYELYFEVIKYPGGQYMFELDRLHNIYGPIIRVNPREVHIRDSSFHDKLYVYRGKVDKDPYFCALMGTSLSMFATSSYDEHKLRRQAANQFFSRASIAALEPKVVRTIDRMTQLLDGYAARGEPFNIRDAVIGVTVNIVSEWFFGDSVNALGGDKFDPKWETMMAGVGEGVPLAKNMPGMGDLLQKVPDGVVNTMNPLLGAFLQFSEWIRVHVQDHRARWQEDAPQPHTEKPGDAATSRELDSMAATGTKPVLRALLESPLLPPSEKEEERLKHECVGMFAGANETTASVIANTTFFLMDTDPSLNIIPRIRAELRTVNSGPFEWRQLERLPFLTAVVKEGLRINATATSRLPRIRPEPVQYGDYIIPGGAVISMTIRDLVHDPAVYPDPLVFRPDRWLDANESERKLMDRNLVAFSRGPRMCIGFQFAYMEIYLFLATLVGRFELELSDTFFERDVKIARDYLVAKPEKGSKGVFTKVKGRREVHG